MIAQTLDPNSTLKSGNEKLPLNLERLGTIRVVAAIVKKETRPGR